MSRFASPRSEDARLDALADSTSLGDLDENDPGSVAQFMKRMGREFGDDLGEEFEEAVDEAMIESARDETAEGPTDAVESPGSAPDADS